MPDPIYHETRRDKPPSLEDRYKAGMTEAGIGGRERQTEAPSDEAIIADTRRHLTPRRERERLEAARRTGEEQGRGFAETVPTPEPQEAQETEKTDVGTYLRTLNDDDLKAVEDALFAEEQERGW